MLELRLERTSWSEVFVSSFVVTSMLSSILSQCHFTSMLRGGQDRVIIVLYEWLHGNWGIECGLRHRREGWWKVLLSGWSCSSHSHPTVWVWGCWDPKTLRAFPGSGYGEASGPMNLTQNWVTSTELIVFCFVLFPFLFGLHFPYSLYVASISQVVLCMLLRIKELLKTKVLNNS